MKEYTIVYNVELTYIERADYTPTDASEPEETERMLKEATGADDVHIKGGVKVFEREL